MPIEEYKIFFRGEGDQFRINVARTLKCKRHTNGISTE